MSDLYFLQVRGGAQEELAEKLIEKTEEMETVSDDNIVIVPEEIEPLNREEAMQYLEEMADALGMAVEEDESG